MNAGAPARKFIRRALGLAAFILAADVLLSLAAWRMAAAAFGAPDPLAVCAPRPAVTTAIVVFYADGAVMRRERLDKAAQLARACPVALVFLVGGARPHIGYFGARDMALTLEGLGVPRARTRTEFQSFDTQGNVRAAAAMAAAAGVTQLALVSDALHLLRIQTVLGGSATGLEFAGFPADGDTGLRRIVSRVNYEAAAWLAMLAPETLREFAFELIGRRGPG